VLSGLRAGFSVAFLSLFPIVNPIGNLPAFFALTAGDSPEARHARAVRTAIYVVLVLALFAIAGRPILHALGISLPALQIAGGVIVAHSAFGMVAGGERLSAREQAEALDKEDVSFTPLAVPMLSGPGAIGVVIALASRAKGVPALLGIVLGIAAMGTVVFVVLRLGEPVVNRLGRTGTGALTRLFGFLILAIAVELIAHGVLALAPSLAR
jgi:multiple antibiotic resistance protein